MAWPTRSFGWPGRERARAVGLAAIVVGAALIVGAVLAGCQMVPPGPTVRPSPSAVERARFVADGIAFEYPTTWQRLDVRGHTSLSDTVVAFIGGSAPPCRAPCDLDALQLAPGSLLFLVTRYASPVPRDATDLIKHPSTTVAGLPAEVEVTVGGRNGADATLTWRFPVPRSVGSWYELAVRVRGPGQDALEAEATAVVGSARADPPLAPLPTDRQARTRILELALDRLAERSTAFRCFPRDVGYRTDVVRQDVWGTALDRPAVVSCAIESVEPTVVGLWKLRLSLRSADGSSGAGMEQLTVWVDAAGAIASMLVEGDIDEG